MGTSISGSTLTFNDATTQTTAAKMFKYSSGSFTGTSATFLSAVRYDANRQYFINLSVRSNTGGALSMSQTLSISSGASMQNYYSESSASLSWSGGGLSASSYYAGTVYFNDLGGNIPGFQGQYVLACPTFSSAVGASFTVVCTAIESSNTASFSSNVRNLGMARIVNGGGSFTAATTITWGVSFNNTANGTYDIYYVPA